MDNLIDDLTKKYASLAKQLMIPVNAVQSKIDTLKKGIETTNEALEKAKEKVRLLQKGTEDLISESSDKFLINRSITDSVNAKLTVETISSALNASKQNLASLKDDRNGLLQARAASLRNLISDNKVLSRPYFLSMLSKSINWQSPGSIYQTTSHRLTVINTVKGLWLILLLLPYRLENMLRT